MLPKSAADVGAALAAKGLPPERARQIGLEIELGILDGEGQPVVYPQVRALLERIASDAPGVWSEVFEGEHLVALKGPMGDSVTLEPGGQVELSDGPMPNVSEGARGAAVKLNAMAKAAGALGLQLVGGGLQPASLEDVHWMPKGRYAIMRAWFASLGQAGHLAHTMMKRTLSVQVSLDYRDAAEAEELLRLAFRAAPAVTAMFAASPWHFGAGEGEFQSFRAEAWRFTDPSRQGTIPTLLDAQSPEAALEAYARHILASPMMFRVRGDDYLAMEGRSFAEVLAAGEWAPGDPVSETDLWNHNGSVFTEARLKPGLIELRSTDGVVPGDDLALSLAEIPALWVGLSYDPEVRARALERLCALPREDFRAAHAAVPRQGFQAPWGSETVADVARDLVDLALEGVARLRESGQEGELASQALEVVKERVARGESPSDDLVRREGQGGRSALLEALRIPSA
jgi:glutamate--cysteine ligase